MLNPPMSQLMKKVDGSFTLCVLVAKRARLLLDGAAPLVECDSGNPVSIAINEIYEGKITYTRDKSGSKKGEAKNSRSVRKFVQQNL